MNTTLYDLAIGSYLQALPATINTLKKAQAFCIEKQLDADSWVSKRLIDDMLPLQFQINSVHWHACGTARALLSGKFTVPPKSEIASFQGLIDHLADGVKELESLSKQEINAREQQSLVFELGERSLPFTVEDFVLSFSLPNLYFHAATAYDILRIEGVPLGKRDFLGQLRLSS